MGTKVTEEQTIYTVPGQPAEPPDELDLRDLGLRLLVAEVTWRWWRDLWAATWAAWVATMKEKDNERE